MKTKINEIFPSIQGEGTIVGYKQLFIRFCSCNLNCNYCDTDYKNGTEYTPHELYEKITSDFDLKLFHSISLTGGEPLYDSEFLKEFLPLIKKDVKVYLETNATLFDRLEKVKPYIDLIAADIKLKSSTGVDTTKLHEKFFENCIGVETFAKIVFDEFITDEEIIKSCEIAQKYNIPLVLQPKMVQDNMAVTSEFCEKILDKFVEKYKDTRLIPQVHKFLNVR